MENPLQYRDLLSSSTLFDAAFYREQNPDVAADGIDPAVHYLVAGWREGRRSSRSFDGQWYLRHNPDVAAAEMNPLVHYLLFGQQEGRQAHKSGVVYTAIVGNYDELRAPLFIDPDLDYVAFVDDWIHLVPAPWIAQRYDAQHGSDRLTARFIKTHPHLLLHEYEFSVWVDAAFQIQCLSAEAAQRSLAGHSLAFFAHPDRDCVYEEAQAILDFNADTPRAVADMVAVLRAAGYPDRSGLVATGIAIRRHRQAPIVEAMDRWWNYIATGSSRDQMSINFVLRQCGIEPAIIPGSIWRNELANWISHAPAPWKGLQCGGAYLDAAEYAAIEDMVRRLAITSAIETGAGETSICFKRLGVDALSIESVAGPWSRRAAAHDCRVAVVPFDSAAGRFHDAEFAAALNGHGDVDLVFIDSPVGTENRRRVLEQILESVKTRYVLYHDVRRDLSNVFSDQGRHNLRLVQFVDSPRGLALYAVNP